MVEIQLSEGRYTQLEKLGAGSFSTVFEVSHRTTNERFVLKRIRLKRKQEEQREQARQELQLAHRLHHPFIVPVQEALDAGHEIYVVFARMRHDLGSMLTQARRNGKRFAEHQLMLWLCQACHALSYLHQTEHVLHRDIKLENLFLSSELDLHIGDFGLSAFMSPTNACSSCVGTPGFIAPECVDEDKPADGTADIFSLGVCFYALTAKKLPFQAFDIPGIFKKVKHTQPPSLPKEYSGEWRQLIREMLRKTPTERPSAADVLNRESMPATEVYNRAAELADRPLKRGSPSPGNARKSKLSSNCIATKRKEATVKTQGQLDGNDDDDLSTASASRDSHMIEPRHENSMHSHPSNIPKGGKQQRSSERSPCTSPVQVVNNHLPRSLYGRADSKHTATRASSAQQCEWDWQSESQRLSLILSAISQAYSSNIEAQEFERLVHSPCISQFKVGDDVLLGATLCNVRYAGPFHKMAGEWLVLEPKHKGECLKKEDKIDGIAYTNDPCTLLVRSDDVSRA